MSTRSVSVAVLDVRHPGFGRRGYEEGVFPRERGYLRAVSSQDDAESGREEKQQQHRRRIDGWVDRWMRQYTRGRSRDSRAVALAWR